MAETFTPYEYQETMLEWLRDHDDALLFVQMGLGKTAVTLTAISELILEGACRGVLLVAPIRVMAITWPDQVARWEHTSWMKIVNMRTEEGLQAWKDHSAQIYMINPEKLPSLTRTVKGKQKKYPGFVEKYIKGNKNLPVDLFVLDESSTAKSSSGKRFKAIKPWLHDNGKFKTPFKRRWGLTGTPAAQSYLGLHNQVLLMDNGKRLGTSFYQFKQRWWDSDYLGWTWTLKKGAKEEIDAKLADIALVMMGEDWLNLPRCEVRDVEVSLPKDAMKKYRTLEKEYLVELETGEIEALSAAALMMKLTQFTAGCAYDAEKDTHLLHDAKLKALKAIRKERKGEPLLVLTSFIHERARVMEAFPEAEELDENSMDRWKAGEIPMWVGDARSLCHGIDGMQESAKALVWMSQTYSNEVYQQANARLVRMGQEHETTIYRVIAKGTVDDAIVEALRVKGDQQDGLMRSIKALQQLRKSEKS